MGLIPNSGKKRGNCLIDQSLIKHKHTFASRRIAACTKRVVAPCEHTIAVQVRFGVLNAGNFGVSQSRKRTFIWGVAPGDAMPEWPSPLHVFRSPQLTISLPGNVQACPGALKTHMPTRDPKHCAWHKEITGLKSNGPTWFILQCHANDEAEKGLCNICFFVFLRRRTRMAAGYSLSELHCPCLIITISMVLPPGVALHNMICYVAC